MVFCVEAPSHGIDFVFVFLLPNIERAFVVAPANGLRYGHSGRQYTFSKWLKRTSVIVLRMLCRDGLFVVGFTTSFHVPSLHFGVDVEIDSCVRRNSVNLIVLIAGSMRNASWLQSGTTRETMGLCSFGFQQAIRKTEIELIHFRDGFFYTALITGIVFTNQYRSTYVCARDRKVRPEIKFLFECTHRNW